MVEQEVFALEIAMNNTLLMTVVDSVTHLSEPDRRLLLRDALLLLDQGQQVAPVRFLHYDVYARVGFDRLQQVHRTFQSNLFFGLTVFVVTPATLC